MFNTPVWLVTRSAFLASGRRFGLYGYHDLFNAHKSLRGAAFNASQCTLSLSLFDVFVVASLGMLVYPQFFLR